ncbi:helix-turn-helix domain-containing protein [Paenibacillus lignilyticus]|uniref:Helix-turn-helix domain-containing protein n=1 Tax=Paenibacillus lignilyticus TaxID=1172615 RepID=A0ABS5CCV4_9BACL|nr:helix-turn-helix domain-containing protein [Paenibacillus lignilyticus]MBP3963827.1 helix-turn-helix domain-containing protein [Paenibacillus lignilyticus]
MRYQESVQRAIDYIEAHLDEEIDLAGLAELTYLSVAQLYRVFSSLTGHPIKDYIRKRRMSVAAAHLRNSKRTIEDLAWESGFESNHSFAKVFKKIVGLTPSAYRQADIYYSFEPIRLEERVAYLEDREQSERFLEVKVIRFMPEKAYAYLHIAEQELGMENEAFRVVNELLAGPQSASKMRIFGHNVDLPSTEGKAQYGYRVLVVCEEEQIRHHAFREVEFVGGLYAVRKVSAKSPKIVQDSWDQLLSDWLPKSTFEIGTHPYVEEFIAYNGKVARMNLYLPVRRKQRNESIVVVSLPSTEAYYCKEHGAGAQEAAERRLIDWHVKQASGIGRDDEGYYYMSYNDGAGDSEEYWWENGILVNARANVLEAGLERKRMGAGLYACRESKTYGQLTGILDSMHRWIAVNGEYRFDEARQWFASYHTLEDGDIERDTLVKLYIPILLVEE